MANIIINNYCNLKCPYCFADDIKHDKPKNMSIKEFKSILEFVGYYESVSILGGEPTLHPKIKQFLELVYQYSSAIEHPCSVFSNGAKLLSLLPWFYEHQDMMRIIFNYNSPQCCPKENFNQAQIILEDVFKHDAMNTMFILGCNIHPLCTDYSYIWDVVQKYNIKIIRIAVASPGGILMSRRNNKEEYYKQLKPLFLQFVNEAIKRDVLLGFDCSQIPRCYFSEEELIDIDSRGIKKALEFCEPPIDILMDGKAIPCFGNYQLINYKQFDNFEQLRHYMKVKVNIDAMLQNNAGRCANCKNFKNYACQGGCLAFSEMNR